MSMSPPRSTPPLKFLILRESVTTLLFYRLRIITYKVRNTNTKIIVFNIVFIAACSVVELL